MIIHDVDIGERLLFMTHEKDYYSRYGCYGQNAVNADPALYELPVSTNAQLWNRQ